MVYVEVSGIGYEVNITLNTYTEIQHMEQGTLYTYLQIKEDGHTLYGFFEHGRKNHVCAADRYQWSGCSNGKNDAVFHKTG